MENALYDFLFTRWVVSVISITAYWFPHINYKRPFWEFRGRKAKIHSFLYLQLLFDCKDT